MSLNTALASDVAPPRPRATTPHPVIRLIVQARSVLELAVTSLPEFVVAITLMILFATVVWHVLPAVSLLAPGTYAWANPRELILPVATLVVVTVPYIIRMTRAAMVEAL